jgi:hypothetical protein
MVKKILAIVDEIATLRSGSPISLALRFPHVVKKKVGGQQEK